MWDNRVVTSDAIVGATRRVAHEREADMKTIESINLIWRRPGCRRGRPTIIGRGLKVKRIVFEHRYGEGNPSPEEIAKRFSATPAQIYAALAYYHQHMADIDADIAEDLRFDNLLKSEGPDAALASRVQVEEPEEASIESLALISRDTEICYASPCVDGTSVRVADIVMAWQDGLGEPAQIAVQHSLSLVQVYGAIAYYYEHIGELDAEIEYERYLKQNPEAELVHK